MVSFAATVLLPVVEPVAITTGWKAGPLPLEFGEGRQAHRDNRATYVDRRACEVLYGSQGQEVRWHRRCDQVVAGPIRLEAVEYLQVDEHSVIRGMLVVHLTAEVEDAAVLLASWGSLVRWTLDDAEGPRALLAPLEQDLGVEVQLLAVHHTPFRLAFVDRVPAGASPVPDSPLTVVNAWHFSLASAVQPGVFVPSAKQADELAASVVQLSSDWSAMVLRDGAAFVGDAHLGEEFLAQFAGAFVRSIYTDALLLAVLQRMVLTDFADRLAALGDPARQPRAVGRLDAEFSRFRNRLWWQHVTHHGIGNDLLRAYGTQHRLPALMEETRSELEDYSRQAALRAGRVLNLVVTALAIVGAVGVFTEVYRFFVEPPDVPATGTLVGAAVVLVVVTAFVFAYPLGVASRMLPHRRRPYVPRPLRTEGRGGRRRH